MKRVTNLEIKQDVKHGCKNMEKNFKYMKEYYIQAHENAFEIMV